MPTKSPKLSARPPHPLDSVQAFQAAADEYLRKNTATPEAARAAMIRIGVYTKSGKLSKHYK